MTYKVEYWFYIDLDYLKEKMEHCSNEFAKISSVYTAQNVENWLESLKLSQTSIQESENILVKMNGEVVEHQKSIVNGENLKELIMDVHQDLLKDVGKLETGDQFPNQAGVHKGNLITKYFNEILGQRVSLKVPDPSPVGVIEDNYIEEELNNHMEESDGRNLASESSENDVDTDWEDKKQSSHQSSHQSATVSRLSDTNNKLDISLSWLEYQKRSCTVIGFLKNSSKG